MGQSGFQDITFPHKNISSLKVLSFFLFRTAKTTCFCGQLLIESILFWDDEARLISLE